MELRSIIEELSAICKTLGLKDVEATILSESANLLIHLKPLPVVARVARYKVNAFEKLKKEVDIATFLNNHQIPSVKPYIQPGPFQCQDYWFTLWQYENIIDHKPPSISHALELLKDLSKILSKYNDTLSPLEIWQNTQNSFHALKQKKHPKINDLIKKFVDVDSYMTHIPMDNLEPCHGDAHIRNLLKTDRGIIWSDFEDVCLMPKYWDFVSIIANPILFSGLSEQAQRIILDYVNEDELKDCLILLKARVLMSIVGNLNMALDGLGDLEFAEMQLERYEESFEAIELFILQNEI